MSDAPDTQYLALASLYLHRMATTNQLHHLVWPTRPLKAVHKQLQILAGRQLVDRIYLPRPGRTALWHLTPTGHALAADWPETRDHDHPQNTDPRSLRLRAGHTLAVLDTHLAFLTEARHHGDEYGPLDWEPEVHHRLSDQRTDALIADALLRYTATSSGTRRQLRAFVEVDRCTMSSERLASKLMSYGRFLEYAPVPAGAARRRQAGEVLPVWQRYYPVFPRVLFVLTGGTRTVMEHRIRDLRAMAAGNPHAARLARTVPLGAALLEDLQQHGPGAAVWVPLAGEDTEPRGWRDL